MNVYLVVPPGLEDLAVLELNEKLPGLDIIDTSRGGVDLEIPDELVPALHYQLKIPTSVRERLYEFKFRDFPRLFNKIQSLKWRDHLVGDAVKVVATSEQSRLGHEKRIVETVESGIARFFSKQPAKKPKEPYTHEIYIRFMNDICVISRELSGAPLFQRGYKDQVAAVAPMRENLAAGLYYAMWKTVGGFDVLIDPMCGSGTFLLEAQLFSHPWTSRDFAFLHDEKWKKSAAIDPVENVFGPVKFYAFDKDEKALQGLQQSLASLAEKIQVDKSQWIIAKRDIFAESETMIEPLTGMRSAIIANPPYGERLKLTKPASEYYPHLLQTLTKLDATSIGLVIPKQYVQYLKANVSGYKLAKTFSFQNGGLDVEFLIYRR